MPVIKKRCYTIPIMGLNTNYGDATTAYFGGRPATPYTVAGNAIQYFTRAGIIREVFLITNSTNVTGSNEAWPYWIRINDTTDYALTSVSAATALRNHTKTGLNIPVTTTDYFEIKTTTPTWATNPDATFTWGYVLIECV